MDTLDGKKLSDFKQWLDEKGHVLGVKVSGKEKLLVDGRSIQYSTTQLIVFRNAIDLEKDVPDDIEVCGVCDGRILNFTWRCSVCGGMVKWHPSKDLVQYLVNTYLAE